MSPILRAAGRLAAPMAVSALAALAALTALHAGSAHAMAVAGPGGTAEQGRRLVVARPAAGASQPSLDLLPARLEAVDLATQVVVVRGQRVPWHAERLRVLGAGGQVLGPAALRAGQSVRLALEPVAPARAATAASAASSAAAGAADAATPARRIVLIYIDG